MNKIEQIKQGIEIIAGALNLPAKDISYALWKSMFSTYDRDVSDLVFEVNQLIKPIPTFVKTKNGKTLVRHSNMIQYSACMGSWSVCFREIDGQLVIWEPTGIARHLHMEPLYPATKEEYEKERDEFYTSKK